LPGLKAQKKELEGLLKKIKKQKITNGVTISDEKSYLIEEP
jgi:hypothetical protein